MLVLFRFKNYGPFKEEAVLDMRAVKSYKEHPYNLLSCQGGDPLLKVVSIYGANASGKSNLVEAYHSFLRIVRQSFQSKDTDEGSSVLADNYKPFLFDAHSSESGTEFEAIYHYEGVEYRYGFIHDQNRIQYEWLYKTSLTTNRRVKVFERTPDQIDLGPSVKKSCEKYIADIDNNVLALSFLSSLKLKTQVFRVVVYCIAAILPTSFSSDLSVNIRLNQYFSRVFEGFNEKEKPSLLAFLNAIDVGIKDIRVEKNKNNLAVYTYHIGKDSQPYPTSIEIESDGTKRAIALYSLVRIAVLQGKGLLFDEFNAQLHPLLQKYLVDLFYQENAYGQLIYITHDTTLMDKQFMRRDQIWFVSKNDAGESALYSLADYKIRNDQSFEKDYLGGIYGGIPILKDFSFKEEQ